MNQLLTESKTGTNGYTASYTYDNNGNLLTRASTDSFGATQYTYNKFGQQIQAVGAV